MPPALRVPFGSSAAVTPPRTCLVSHRPRRTADQSGSFSDALTRFESPGSDRLDELLVVLFVLIGVALREVGDGPVKGVAVAQVRAHRDGISRSGVRSRQRPAAGTGVEGEP